MPIRIDFPFSQSSLPPTNVGELPSGERREVLVPIRYSEPADAAITVSPSEHFRLIPHGIVSSNLADATTDVFHVSGTAKCRFLGIIEPAQLERLVDFTIVDDANAEPNVISKTLRVHLKSAPSGQLSVIPVRIGYEQGGVHREVRLVLRYAIE